MGWTPGRASGRKNVAPKHFMIAQLKRGHCTARSTVLDKSEGGQIAVGLDPFNEGVQPDLGTTKK